jgi:hypothetical protein
MIATKREDLRVIDYSVFCIESNTEAVLDEFQAIDETYDNPLNNWDIRKPTDAEWDAYLEYTSQGQDRQ